MTDTVFYDEMFKLATDLLNDFGTPATLRKISPGKPNEEGKTEPTFVDHPGLGVRISDKSMIEALDLTGDVVYATKFPAAGDDSDLIIHAGDTYTILSSNFVNPEGTRLMVAFYGVKRA